MKNFVARSAYVFVFMTLILASDAQADTELKFEKAVFYEGAGNQVGNAVEFGAGRLYVAGMEALSDPKSLVASYTIPPTGLPLTDFRWSDEQKGATSVSTIFSDLAVSSEGLYFSGSSLAQMSGKKKTTQLLGILAKFPLDKSDARPLWVAHSKVSSEFKEEVFRSVAAATEQNSTVVYVTGHAVTGNDNLTAILEKYDANGNLLWSKLIGDAGKLKKSGGTALVVSGDYIYVAGFTNSEGEKFNTLPLNVALWKYDLSGNQVWKKTSSTELYGFSTSNQDNLTHGVKVELTISDKYLYLTSGKKDTKASPGDILLLKYDLEGQLILENGWTVKLDDGDSAKNVWSLGIAAGKDRLYVVGYLERKGKKQNEDIFILEIDKDYGSVLAKHIYGEPNQLENALGITVAGTDVYVVGTRKSLADPDKKKSQENMDFVLLRYSTLPVTTVTIDIEPSTSQNNIVLKGGKQAEDVGKKKKKKDEPKENRVAVAILSTSEFKAATQVNLDSLTFGRTGNEASWDGCNTNDMNGDGVSDLLCYFKTSWKIWEGLKSEEPTFIFQNGDTEGILKGQTKSGERFSGKDVVKVGESSPAPTPTPEPEPPAPTPAPEPTPTLEPESTVSTSEPAPTLISEPQQSSTSPTLTTNSEPITEPEPIIEEPSTSISESEPTQTSELESTVLTSEPVTTTSLSTTQETTTSQPTTTQTEAVIQPVFITAPTITTSTAPSTTETDQEEEQALPPVIHATIIQPTTEPVTTQPTYASQPVFIPQPTATSNQPTIASTVPVAPKTVTSGTSSPSGLPAIYGSRSGEVQHASGMFSSETDSETETFESQDEPRQAESLKSEGEASRSESGLGRAYGDLGKKAFQEGKFSEAMTHYAEALKLDPQSPELHTDFGLVLVQEGRLEEARTHFEEALKLNPDDQVARENLNLILAKLDKPAVEITPAAPVSNQSPAPKA